ncbi:exonuclease 3'-5' domain-containing protein 2 [Ostrinia furnacalis]|uniref:exonuclease 3'-5' domain-containing protein 2 n=1 Tax=Ostrinia furnacalis TaxID=93504 RepID=UPI00103EDB20|nr:exonuclease 3'-5' domain-containing protein 2 [Ostrinia furnacalis]
MEFSNLNVNLTSAAVLLGCAGLTYWFYYKNKLRDASNAFKYLTIKVVTNETLCNEVILELKRRCQSHHAIGFDCEWVTEHGKRNPVALLQLSSFDGYCGLIRLNQLKYVPDSLKELLEDKSIYKVGLAPSDDARYLHHDYGVATEGTLDLRHIAHLVGHKVGGLGALSQSLLGVVLDKSWRIRCSDWEAEDLSTRQVRYASADAHVAIKMFVRLVNDLNKNNRWLSMKRNGEIWDNLDKFCWQYCDIRFKTNKMDRQGKNDTNKVKQLKKKDKELVSSKRYPHAVRSRPLYHNCFLQAPDGDLLCTCDDRKAMWYVEKQIADVVKDDPLTVRLRFEPSGRANGSVGAYYKLTKENKCVVCGAGNIYIRKNVVPREYRKYFPEVMKEHSSHDVVPLCVPCHQRSNISDQAVRERLADKCSAPLDVKRSAKYAEDVTCKKIRSAARALLVQSKKHVLPEDRRKKLEAVLLEHYKEHEKITEELLAEASEIQVMFENSDYESHGQKVVEYFVAHGGLLQLEQMWREHFLQTMRPQHMPELWSVRHNEERLRIRLSEGRLPKEDMKLIGITGWLT